MVKLSPIKNNPILFTDSVKKELGFYQRLSAHPEFAEVVGAFNYPTKDSRFREGTKTTLIQNYYEHNITLRRSEEDPPLRSDILDRWDESDLKKLTLTILRSIQALNKHRIYNSDIQYFCNVLFNLDSEGHIAKVVVTDLEKAVFWDDKKFWSDSDNQTNHDREHRFILPTILDNLAEVYFYKKYPIPLAFKEAFWKVGGRSAGFKLFGNNHQTQIDQLVETLKKGSEEYWNAYRAIHQNYIHQIEHKPTITLDQLIKRLDPNDNSNCRIC